MHTDHTQVTSEEELLDYGRAAALLTVQPAALRRWVFQRRIPHLRLGPRTVRFRRNELLRWLAEAEVPPTTATPTP